MAITPVRAFAADNPEIEKLRRELSAKLQALKLPRHRPSVLCDDRNLPYPPVGGAAVHQQSDHNPLLEPTGDVCVLRAPSTAHCERRGLPDAGVRRDIDALGAQLLIHRTTPSWNVTTPTKPILTVRPAISFGLRYRFSGVIRGRAFPATGSSGKPAAIARSVEVSAPRSERRQSFGHVRDPDGVRVFREPAQGRRVAARGKEAQGDRRVGLGMFGGLVSSGFQSASTGAVLILHVTRTWNGRASRPGGQYGSTRCS